MLVVSRPLSMRTPRAEDASCRGCLVPRMSRAEDASCRGCLVPRMSRAENASFPRFRARLSLLCVCRFPRASRLAAGRMPPAPVRPACRASSGFLQPRLPVYSLPIALWRTTRHEDTQTHDLCAGRRRPHGRDVGRRRRGGRAGQEVHLDRHRRPDRRLLRGRQLGLPHGPQGGRRGPQVGPQARHPLRCAVHRRLDLQYRPDLRGRARLRRGPVRLAVPCG